MQTLLSSTSAYKLLQSERNENRLNHAYLILMDDARSLRLALSVFARVFFACEDENQGGRVERIAELIEKETFSDCLFFPKKDKKFAVSDVDEIKEESALNPVESDKKLFVIGDFAELGVAQQNKLLKLLEEPPENVYFLLGATTSYPILQTVLSRTKKLEIPPFSEKEIYAFLLRNYPEKESERELLKIYASASNGSVGNAQNSLEGGYFSELIRDGFALSLQPKDLPVIAKRLADSKHKKELLSLLRLIFRDALFLKIGKSGHVLLASERENLEKVGSRYGLNALVYAQEMLTQAEKQLKFNTNFSQCLEILFENISNRNER